MTDSLKELGLLIDLVRASQVRGAVSRPQAWRGGSHGDQRPTAADTQVYVLLPLPWEWGWESGATHLPGKVWSGWGWIGKGHVSS